MALGGGWSGEAVVFDYSPESMADPVETAIGNNWSESLDWLNKNWPDALSCGFSDGTIGSRYVI